MRKTRLLFAVKAKDAFNPKKKVVGKCAVEVNGGETETIMNRSGFYCVVDQPAGEYAVTLRNKFYCDKEISFNTEDLDPRTPAVDIELEPGLLYVFPKGTTILRGKVIDEDEEAIADAVVEVKEIDKEFLTDAMGRFVFYFAELEDDEEKVEVEVTKSGFKNEKVNFDVVKGETNPLEITLKAE